MTAPSVGETCGRSTYNRGRMPVRILAIETSCDETAAAVIDDGRHIRSNVVASQIALHEQYGGVFPEMASRAHIEAIGAVIRQAVAEADVSWDSLNAVAVTRGPGLPGSLVVGMNAAKGVALARNLPLIGVNHLEGHVYAHWLDQGGVDDPLVLRLIKAFETPFPLLSLIVSGGHTELVLVHDHGEYELIGHTVDDAAGEAFDKVARLLNLGYPGGPAIQKAAAAGNPARFKFSRPKVNPGSRRMRGTRDEYLMSFSGAKTAALHIVQQHAIDGQLSPYAPVADIAASFQDAVTDWLVEKAEQAAKAFEVKAVLVGGGVSANALLREKFQKRFGVAVSFPPLALCTDNAAMIGAAAHARFVRGLTDDLSLDVEPDLKLG
jgi:N6-L-threonylcarbamoyladenine synthase